MERASLKAVICILREGEIAYGLKNKRKGRTAMSDCMMCKSLYVNESAYIFCQAITTTPTKWKPGGTLSGVKRESHTASAAVARGSGGRTSAVAGHFEDCLGGIGKET